VQVPNRMLADDAELSSLIRRSSTAVSAGIPERTAISAMIVVTLTLPNDPGSAWQSDSVYGRMRCLLQLSFDVIHLLGGVQFPKREQFSDIVPLEHHGTDKILVIGFS
jgi:hypothetical protein